MRVRLHVCSPLPQVLQTVQPHAPRSTREKHFPVRVQRRMAHLRFTGFSQGEYLRVIASLCIALMPCGRGVARQVAYCRMEVARLVCWPFLVSTERCNLGDAKATNTFIGPRDHVLTTGTLL
jgi:hypothetical protein